jgi:hypothetical protein
MAASGEQGRREAARKAGRWGLRGGLGGCIAPGHRAGLGRASGRLTMCGPLNPRPVGQHPPPITPPCAAPTSSHPLPPLLRPPAAHQASPRSNACPPPGSSCTWSSASR